MQKCLSIACASGFWGDTPWAVPQLLQEQNLDYIVFDYLSEVTLTILAKQKKRDPEVGYTADFLSDVIEPHLKAIVDRKIKLVSNAGGMNPAALKKRIEAVAKAQGLQLNISCVTGDDLLGKLPEFVQDLDGKTITTKNFVSANVYLGAPAVVAALQTGADIVLTGRVVDTALVLGPVMHAFNARWDDFNFLAQASLAGHILECGAQCCGGNFTDWQKVSGRDNIGFPIARFYPNGHFEITKPAHTGGIVSGATVAEQIVYEIANPRAYVLPDVICDFSQVQLQQKAQNVVEVTGAKGSAPTAMYKICATQIEGMKIAATALVSGGDALAKAKSNGQAILARSERFLKEKSLAPYTETLLESLGGAQHALLRISAAHAQTEALEILAKEMAPAATSLAPGMTNLLGGRAQPTPRIRLQSFLWEKAKVSIAIDDKGLLSLPAVKYGEVSKPSPSQSQKDFGKLVDVKLIDLAYARSGDKGNHVNIGVIARKPEYYEPLLQLLTTEMVKDFFANDFDGGTKAVEAWPLPGLRAINFLLKDCLGGGGAFSLRADPQGKAFAQRLLNMSLAFPEGLL